MDTRSSASLLRTLAMIAATVLVSTIFPGPAIGIPQGSKVAASLEGTVKDSSGAAVPSAAVAIRNASTNQARDVITDEAGNFHAEALAVGSYAGDLSSVSEFHILKGLRKSTLGHSERSGESLWALNLHPGGILRCAQNDVQGLFSSL